MIRFLVRRLVFLLGTVFVVSILSFSIPYLGKSDPARIILQSRVGAAAVDPARVAQVRQQLGLDRPIWIQYIDWVRQVVHGNLGYSFTNQQPVSTLVLDAVRISILLALAALGIAIVIALPLGIISAAKPGGKRDLFITGATQVLIPIPEYWSGPFAILVLAVWWHVFPAAGWFGLKYVVLPAFVLALRPLAYLTSITRASMIDVLSSEYITASRSRGLGRTKTVLQHGIRNSMPPIMTMFSLYLASLVGGSVIVEVIFAIPGTGRLLYSSVVDSDIPTIQGAILCVVSLVVVITTAADIS
ncbi:MAG: transporter permease, partial [Pseudonocardiales bacterium]|nr:transporter permease [Pseudonocardiales bacterium]